MGVKHCEYHGKYTPGCPNCQVASRHYQAERRRQKVIPRKPNKTAYGSADMWSRMTDIGQRWEREGRT